jgi:hypothetical protein
MNLLSKNKQFLQSMLQFREMAIYVIIGSLFFLSLLAIIVPVKLQQAWEAS